MQWQEYLYNCRRKVQQCVRTGAITGVAHANTIDSSYIDLRQQEFWKPEKQTEFSLSTKVIELNIQEYPKLRADVHAFCLLDIAAQKV